MIKKILVIGSGSIALRHIKNIKIIDPKSKIFLYSKTKRYKRIKNFLSTYSIDKIHNINIKEKKFTHLIIASETSSHSIYIKKFYKLIPNIYCEKPIPIDKNYSFLKKLTTTEKKKIYVGFQWRFNPTVNFIKNYILKNIGKIYRFEISIGQHLSQWRKNTNYKKINYSKLKKYSGVHWELCHELDLINYFFNDEIEIKTTFSSSKKLKIKIIDNVISTIKLKKKNILCYLSQDMLSPKLIHKVKIYTVEKSYEFDLVQNNFHELNSKKKKTIVKYFKRNEMFLLSLKEFINYKGNKKIKSASLIDGLKTAEQILKMESK